MIDNLNVKHFNIITVCNVCLIRIQTAEEEKILEFSEMKYFKSILTMPLMNSVY